MDSLDKPDVRSGTFVLVWETTIEWQRTVAIEADKRRQVINCAFSTKSLCN